MYNIVHTQQLIWVWAQSMTSDVTLGHLSLSKSTHRMISEYRADQWKHDDVYKYAIWYIVWLHCDSVASQEGHTCVLFPKIFLQHVDFQTNAHKFQILCWVICVKDAYVRNINSWAYGDLYQISDDYISS